MIFSVAILALRIVICGFFKNLQNQTKLLPATRKGPKIQSKIKVKDCLSTLGPTKIINFFFHDFFKIFFFCKKLQKNVQNSCFFIFRKNGFYSTIGPKFDLLFLFLFSPRLEKKKPNFSRGFYFYKINVRIQNVLYKAKFQSNFIF